MTGSGKTGLGVVLIEEALTSGVPCLLIDPKGDLTNLCLTFPDLAPADFRPWINEGDAQKAGLTPDAFAEQQATTWKEGLAGWGITPERIKALRDAVGFTIYTPGSTVGRAAEHRRLAAGAGRRERHGDGAGRDRGLRVRPARAGRHRGRPAVVARAHPAQQPDRDGVDAGPVPRSRHAGRPGAAAAAAQARACSSWTSSSRPPTARRWPSGSTGCWPRRRSRRGPTGRRSTSTRSCARRTASRPRPSSPSPTCPTRSASSSWRWCCPSW